MSIRAIVVATRAAADAMRDRINAANGLPRCERLAGNARNTDGSPLAPCRCAVATSPHATCIYATRALMQIHALTTATQHAVEVNESIAATLRGLTAPEIATIATVADAVIRRPSHGESQSVAVAAQER